MRTFRWSYRKLTAAVGSAGFDEVLIRARGGRAAPQVDALEERIVLSTVEAYRQAMNDFAGMSNLDEYRAGTDPRNALSVLKLEVQLTESTRDLLLRFAAVSNKSYTIQYRGALGTGNWRDLLNIAAEPANRLVSVTNAIPAEPGAGYYRLVTPRQQ